MTTQSRHASITHHIRRLENRLKALYQVERRFAWYRLIAFLSGALLTWAAASYFGALAGWFALGLSAGVFFTVVAFHRRLDKWIDKLKIWQELKINQDARLMLDWENLPQPAVIPEHERCTLDVDLDLTGSRSLHHLLDNTISIGGSRRLAKWLHAGAPDLKKLKHRQPLVQELIRMRRFRDRLQLTYRLAAKQRLQGDDLLTWLNTEYPENRIRKALPVALFLSVTNLVLFVLDILGVLPAYWPLSMVVYLGFYYFHASDLSPFLDTILLLDNQLSSFRPILSYLETYRIQPDSHLGQLCSSCRGADQRPSRQLQRVKWLTAAVGVRMNPVAGLLLNVLLPWDFVTAQLIARQRRHLKSLLPSWLETIEQLEALIALAEFGYLHPEHSFPNIDPNHEKAISAKDLSHPLLPPDSKVCNDFELNGVGEIAIITGSNMAGKSTFIKTVGINLCLAYAGAPVDAREFGAIPMRLHTCIRISDSITDGFSYFYAEVRCLKTLLDKIETPEATYPLLYMIDEIFRGTNNRERLAGSRAYLQTLIGARGLGLLATHDLELASLADESIHVHNYHFRDDVQDGRLVFDYKIRTGPSPTTNALRIMEMEGLPVKL